MANKAPKPSALAPGVFPVIDYSTPDIRDTLVYLEVDSRLGNYKQPDYGSKYAGPRGHLRNDPWAEEGTTPDKIGRFDQHELVHITPADERGMVRWYYARRREDQALYNWEYTTPGPNSDGYPTYTRTYFVHRNDLTDYYDEYPTNPSNPGDLEPVGDKHLKPGDADPDLSYTPQFYGFEYADTQIARIGDENLDSLYVLVVRRFELLCDKTTFTENETYGTVANTVVFDSDVDNTYSLGAEYPPESGKFIIDLNEKFIGCSEDYRRVDISTVIIPTLPSISERVDKEFCNITTKRWVDFDASRNAGVGTLLPDIGSADPLDSTRIVIDSSLESIGQSALAVFTVSYGVFPTAPVTTIREDQQYCRINTESYYALADTTDLPSVGDVLDGGEVVVDATAQDISCGDVRKFAVSSAALPTPIVTVETLNNDYCRVITETNYDLRTNIGALPEYGDSHATEAGYQVIEAQLDEIGCGELTRRSISYANVPTSPRVNQIDDPDFCRVSEAFFYDLLADFDLPAKGDVYADGYVIEAKADAVGCGDLMRFSIRYAELPTPVVTTKTTSDEWCDTYTEKHYDLASSLTTLPSLGDARANGYVVVDAKIDDIGCGEVRKSTVTCAKVPSEIRTTESEHPEYCTLITDTFYHLDSYALPAQGDAYSGGYVVDAQAADINCGTVRRITIGYVTLPTSKRYEHREDDTYCGVETERFLDSDTYTTPALGSVYGAGAVIDVSSRDIGCGGITEYTITSGVVPSPKKISERTDNEQCRIVTESFVDVDTYALPAMHSAHTTDTELKVVNTASTPLGCRGIANYQITYAVIPSPPRTTEYDDPRYCRVNVDTYYDIDGIAALPLVGDVYSTGTVVEAKAMDVDCEGLRKYEVHYVTLPIVNVSESADSTYCTTTKTETYDLTTTLGALPQQGSDNTAGQTILEVSRDVIGCGTISKQTEISTFLPSPQLLTIAADDNFCEIQTKVVYDKSNASFSDIGDSGGLGYVIDKRVTPTGCGGVVRYEETTAAVPSPLTTVTNSDNKYCTITEYRQIVEDSATQDYTIGDTLSDSSIVVDYQQRLYKCDKFVIESYKSIPALPTEVKTASFESPDYCDGNIDTFFDLTTSDQPIVGDDRGTDGQVVVQVTQKPVCGELVEFEIRYAQIGDTYKKTSEGIHDLFCNVTNISYVDKTDDVTVYSRGDADPDDASAVIIEFSTTPLGCGILSRVNYTVGTVPSDLLTGHRINQVTGKLETYSKKVIKNTSIDAEKQDVDVDGNYTMIEPYGCGLSLAETANIRPFDTLEYDTTIQYTFPRVLNRIDLFIWPLKKGGNEIYPQFLWSKVGYSGPVQARVVETWHLTKPDVQVPVVLMPGVLIYNSPALKVSTPPCLHGQITFKADYGTNDKKYAYTYNSDWSYNPTTYTDWPTGEFLAAWSCRPAYGGFVSKAVHITAPQV